MNQIIDWSIDVFCYMFQYFTHSAAALFNSIIDNATAVITNSKTVTVDETNARNKNQNAPCKKKRKPQLNDSKWACMRVMKHESACVCVIMHVCVRACMHVSARIYARDRVNARERAYAHERARAYARERA